LGSAVEGTTYSLDISSQIPGLFTTPVSGAVCHEDPAGEGWAVSVPLKLDPEVSVCIDYLGNYQLSNPDLSDSDPTKYLQPNEFTCP
jgi:hypothetical protein